MCSHLHRHTARNVHPSSTKSRNPPKTPILTVQQLRNAAPLTLEIYGRDTASNPREISAAQFARLVTEAGTPLIGVDGRLTPVRHYHRGLLGIAMERISAFDDPEVVLQRERYLRLDEARTAKRLLVEAARVCDDGDYKVPFYW